MNLFSYIFSFLCSQDPSRSFVIAGHILPFCQRCTGLYVGMGISFVYLLTGRLYKKGFPPLSILYVNIASLLIMPILGFHLLDPGPVWRFWSGLVYGNAIASLTLPAASIIWHEGKVFGRYTKISTALPWILFVFLNTIPLWFPIQSTYFYYLILALSLTGLLCILVCVVLAIVLLLKKPACRQAGLLLPCF